MNAIMSIFPTRALEQGLGFLTRCYYLSIFVWIAILVVAVTTPVTSYESAVFIVGESQFDPLGNHGI